jgi:predicted metal-binding membrane protein
MSMTSVGSPAPTVRKAASIWLGLLFLSGLAWLVTGLQARSMGVGPGTMGMAPLLFTGMWVAMMAAMMWPAVAPQAVLETGALPRREAGQEHLSGVAAFVTGFIFPWALYGALAFLALLGTGRLVDASPTAAKWLGVGILALAGIYQFTPAKDRFLSHCRLIRTPPGAESNSLRTNFGLGARDGAICVGCCWALMAILLAVGVMNLVAMAGLFVVIFTEKLAPRPTLVARGGGVAFLVLAVVAAFHPSLLGGLHAAGEMMPMGGM